MFVRFEAIPSMTLQDIKELCTYKSHKELQREITLIVLAPSPLIFISIIFLVHMYVFAKLDKKIVPLFFTYQSIFQIHLGIVPLSLTFHCVFFGYPHPFFG